MRGYRLTALLVDRSTAAKVSVTTQVVPLANQTECPYTEWDFDGRDYYYIDKRHNKPPLPSSTPLKAFEKAVGWLRA